MNCPASRKSPVRPQPKVYLLPAGLLAILPQDPDVVMVGEIRDSETAEIAIRAALTGRIEFYALSTPTTPLAR